MTYKGSHYKWTILFVIEDASKLKLYYCLYNSQKKEKQTESTC